MIRPFFRSSFLTLITVASLSPLIASTTPLDFQEAYTLFLTHNHEIKISANDPLSAKADLTTASLKPNPVLSGAYDYFDYGRFKAVNPSANAYAYLHLDYTFETGDKRAKRMKAASQLVEQQEWLHKDFRTQQSKLFADLFFTLLGDQMAMHNAQENLTSYQKLLEVAQAKFKNGFLSKVELDKLLLKESDFKTDVMTQTTIFQQDKADFEHILGDTLLVETLQDPAFPIQVSSLETYLQLALAHRHDIKAMMAKINAAQATLESEKAKALPDVTIGLEYEAYAPRYEPLAGISFSLPLPVYNTNQGGIQHATIDLQTSILAQKNLTSTLKATLTKSYWAFIDAKKKKELYENSLTQAKQLKENYEKIFAIKGISILELLDALTSYREVQKNYYTALYDLENQAFQLQLDCGLTPQNDQ